MIQPKNEQISEWQQNCLSLDDNFDQINEPTDKQSGEVPNHNILGTTCMKIKIECRIVSSRSSVYKT